MYASNEDEYDREDSDWILLRQTPPINTVKYFSNSFGFCLYFIYLC
jgi:hypothetical protein